MAQSRNERHLIEAAQRDPSRFGELYEIHFDRIYAYIARRVRDRAEAQDLTSEVFHQALKHIGGYESRGVAFATWLYRIAANAIIDHVHRRSREAGAVEVEPLTDAGIEEAEYRAGIFRLVRELPEDQRRVIELRYAEDKSIRETAEALGRSEGAIKQLQFRGLETLRARIGGQNG
jgi:RNA polymerase sigma-70 factor, ECF subfamily